MKGIATLVLITAIMGPGIYGCAGGGSTISPSASNTTLNSTPTTALNPTPAIITVSPNSAVAGSAAAFVLTINGTNSISSQLRRSTLAVQRVPPRS